MQFNLKGSTERDEILIEYPYLCPYFFSLWPSLPVHASNSQTYTYTTLSVHQQIVNEYIAFLILSWPFCHCPFEGKFNSIKLTFHILHRSSPITTSQTCFFECPSRMQDITAVQPMPGEHGSGLHAHLGIANHQSLSKILFINLGLFRYRFVLMGSLRCKCQTYIASKICIALLFS